MLQSWYDRLPVRSIFWSELASEGTVDPVHSVLSVARRLLLLLIVKFPFVSVLLLHLLPIKGATTRRGHTNHVTLIGDDEEPLDADVTFPIDNTATLDDDDEPLIS